MGSVVVARGLWSAGSVVVAHRLRCSAACGIFPDQGSNPCPLHWQVDSFFFLIIIFCLRWVFAAACELSLVAGSGAYSLLWCAGFSSQWLLVEEHGL